MDRPPSTHRIVTGVGGEPVLVKRATDEAGRVRLRAEATVLQALRHPGVVQVAAVVEDEGGCELHLAWVGSHTLATVTGLAVEASAVVVATLAATVADVHAAGLVHRRLSPDHVVLGPGGRPVLTGFAEARRADRADPADDVAALGALLAALVAGRPPVLALPERRRDRWPIRSRWDPAGGGGERPRHHRGLRAALLTLADQAQADDPSSRPSATELAALLRTAAGLDPGRPRPEGRAARWRPASRPEPGSSPSATPPRPVAPVRPDPGPRVRPRAGGRPRPSRPAVVVVLVLGLGASALAVVAVRAPSGGDRPGGPASAHPGPAAPRAVPVPRGEGSVPAVGPEPVLDPPPSSGSAPAPRDQEGVPADPPSVLPPAPSPEPPCPPVPPGAVDVDGDGCPEVVRVEGERVVVGPTTWRAGRPGDAVAVGDWDCDGTATAAVLRPATGEVFVFDGWVAGDDQITVGSVARVPGPDGIAGIPGGGAGCSDLVVTGPGGRRTPVLVGGAP